MMIVMMMMIMMMMVVCPPYYSVGLRGGRSAATGVYYCEVGVTHIHNSKLISNIKHYDIVDWNKMRRSPCPDTSATHFAVHS